MNQLQLTRFGKSLLLVLVGFFVLDHGSRLFLGAGHNGVTSFFSFTVESGFLHFELWRWVTYSLLHADITHLMFNLISIVFVLPDFERAWGIRRTVQFMLVTNIGGAALFSSAVYLLNPSMLGVPLVGISAAIFGLLGAFGIIFGERQILFMLMFPIAAKHFVLVLMGIEVLTAMSSPAQIWSVAAHLGGLLTGIAYLRLESAWIARRAVRSAERSLRPKRDQHLRLIVDNDRPKGKPNSKNDPTWH